MEGQDRADDAARNARIVSMRDAGASWKEVQEEFGLTRQQARYAYQLGKRAERRGQRLTKD
jgi:uncharacterized protein (DUF433 family)